MAKLLPFLIVRLLRRYLISNDLCFLVSSSTNIKGVAVDKSIKIDLWLGLKSAQTEPKRKRDGFSTHLPYQTCK